MDLTVTGGRSLAGEIRVPSDKSILHRALIFAALAEGTSRIRFHEMGEDCRSTKRVLEHLGVAITEAGNLLEVDGRGPGGLVEPRDVLDCGNSGTTMRLLLGVLAGRPFRARLTGDESLRKRPMRRVVEPLVAMGAEITGEDGAARAPLEIRGGELRAIRHRSAVASAQVKSAVLLAAMQARGATVFEEPVPSRDHTERMLAAMGARLDKDGGAISLAGPAELRPIQMGVPGDASSAAFFLGAAAMIPGSLVTIREVGLNPTRTGFLRVLERMGAECAGDVETVTAGEPIGSMRVRAAALHGVEITPGEVPSLIDELPLLAAVATRAEGTTRVTGAAELRVKESDRITCLVSELRKLGADAAELPDGFEIRGPARLRGTSVSSHGDHRLAMALAVLGLAAEGRTVVENAACAAVSFPGFEGSLRELATSW